MFHTLWKLIGSHPALRLRASAALDEQARENETLSFSQYRET
jgi:hypothetical protein